MTGARDGTSSLLDQRNTYAHAHGVARHDYQGALDAYEHAKRAVPRLAAADEVTAVVDTLSTARYLLACVRAELAGLPRPGNRREGGLGGL